MKIGGFREKEEWDEGLVTICCCQAPVLRVYMHCLPQDHRAGRQQDWNLDRGQYKSPGQQVFHHFEDQSLIPSHG